MKTGLIALLVALTITGCDQVIHRLSNKTSNNPSVVQPETAKESSPKDISRGAEIPAKTDGREGDKKPAEHAINRNQPSPKMNQAQRDDQKKTDVINQQQETATVDSKGKSAIQEKRKAEAKRSEVDDKDIGTVRRGNVSREY